MEAISRTLGFTSCFAVAFRPLSSVMLAPILDQLSRTFRTSLAGRRQPRLPEQRIDGALEVAEDRSDSPPLDQPAARARLLQAPCPSHHRIGLARVAHGDQPPERPELDRTDPQPHSPTTPPRQTAPAPPRIVGLAQCRDVVLRCLRLPAISTATMPRKAAISPSFASIAAP
jgi:hypothetical protein